MMLILKYVLYGWLTLSAIAIAWFVYEAKNALEYPYDESSFTGEDI
jgi:hypothetical protein